MLKSHFSGLILLTFCKDHRMNYENYENILDKVIEIVYSGYYWYDKICYIYYIYDCIT